MIRAVWLPLVLALGLTACSDSDDNDNDTSSPGGPDTPIETSEFSAEIRRTEFGIPHITADDWKGLGYGHGYAYAQDNFCVLMRLVVEASGRSAELMGETQGRLDADFLQRFINGDKESFEQEVVAQLPQFAIDVAEGFTAGMNRYLRETGVDSLPEGDQGCRGEPWVAEFDSIDYWMYLRKVALRGSSDQGIFRRALLSVEGPGSAAAQLAPGEALAAGDGLRHASEVLRSVNQGSNALAVGRDSTQDGSGLLLGNPHQPWFGDGAWYQSQLTIPGVYDVAGASLHGTPIIGIGFTKDLAWTHTVSLANRFSLYELQLNPDNPLQYWYDGEWIDIGQELIEVQALQDDGTMETRGYTFYTSQYGPIVNLRAEEPLLDGWPMVTGSILAFRDANLDTGPRLIQQWVEKAQATDLDGYVEALSTIGNPVFHDIAADRNGDIFYGEISAIPFITQEQLDRCINGLVGPLLADLTTNVIVSLDGSDPFCEWGNDPEAPAGSNLYGSSQLPQIRSTDYVGNSNNGYWLSDANNPLTGFPVIMGPVGYEGNQQFLRTRIGHLMVEERKAATDGLDDTPLFTFENLKDFMYANRVYGAEVVLDDVLTICNTEPAESVLEACGALAGWDRKVDLDSRGAQVFLEFWSAIRDELQNPFQNVVQSDEFWAVDFDPEDPLNTPSGIDTSIEANHTRVIAALQRAMDRLGDAGVALDAAWRDVQVLERNDERVPIHGGAGTAGIYGAISVGLSEGGYINPRAGNSYIQVVTWDDSECPIADVILVPSQSTDPTSPYFADQTKLYSEKEWVRFPFCEEQISATQIGETLQIEE
ncbi:MAG: penicillin acylase family protein [Pseudomonadota bacterium]